MVGRLVSQRRPELLLVEIGKVDLTDDDALIRYPEDGLLRAHLRSLHQLRDGLRDRTRIDDLAVDDGTLGQGGLAEADERGASAAARYLGDTHRARANVHPHGGTRSQRHHASPPVRTARSSR